MDRKFVSLPFITFFPRQSVLVFTASLFTKAFYELFMRWICETNPKDLRNFPSGVSGYVLECFLSMDGLVFFLTKKKWTSPLFLLELSLLSFRLLTKQIWNINKK